MRYYVAKARSRETVRHNIRQWAKRRGHRLAPFRQVGQLPMWVAACTTESCSGTVALHGDVQHRYGGPALEMDCPIRITYDVAGVTHHPETY